MKIKAAIVDKLPESTFVCPEYRGITIDPNYNGEPIMKVNCALFRHVTIVKVFHYGLERCIFCPLMTEEEYKAKLALEAE